MTDDKAKTVYEVTFLITIDIAFKMLEEGTLTLTEFRRFFDEMHQKYKCENVRRLYQSKLDIYLVQSVNVDTKGA